MLQWVNPFRTSAKQPNKLQPTYEYLSVEVSLLCGEHTILRIEPSQQLCTVFDLITSQTSIPQSCQSVVVSEVRRRSRGLGAAASEIVHSWKARKSTQSLVLGLVNYMLLPQVVGREFGQQGFYHWAKAGLQQGFRERPQGTVTVVVHKLDGLVITLDMSVDFSLQETQAMVQQQAGILLDRQRFTIEECLPPTRLSQLSNQLLLGSFQGFKAAAQVAQWASHRLRRHVWGATHHFPLAVTTQSGQTVTVNATMDMTVAELQNAVYHNMSAAPTQPASQFPIQQVTFDHMGVSAAKKVSDATSSASSPVSKGKG